MTLIKYSGISSFHKTPGAYASGSGQHSVWHLWQAGRRRIQFHYQAHGYHPLLCYDGLTGDLIKAELRDGTLYCSNGADKFMESIFQEYLERGIKTYLRGDSGFSSPKLYETCESNGCSYAIRLKQNPALIALASDKDEDLYKATQKDQISYAVTYGEFMYQAGSWKYPRRVVFKIEKPYGQLTHMYTFIVTNMDMEPYQIIQFTVVGARWKTFIKEGKSGFDFAAVSSHSKIVKCQPHETSHACLQLIQQQVDTIRLKLIKIAAKTIHSARSITFKPDSYSHTQYLFPDSPDFRGMPTLRHHSPEERHRKAAPEASGIFSFSDPYPCSKPYRGPQYLFCPS